MKKFSKLFLSCAAVAAVTAAVATSAMAAGISATYAPADATHETATLTIDASGYTAAQKTLLVLKPGKTLETVKVSEGDVLQIDQQDGNDTITVALPKGSLQTVNTQFTWVATVRFIQQTSKLEQVLMKNISLVTLIAMARSEQAMLMQFCGTQLMIKL